MSSRSLPAKTDIIIAGAGLAGVSAALFAARRGYCVTLIEKERLPGGTALGMRHRYLCGLYPNSTTKPRQYLNPGISEEFGAELAPNTSPVKMGKVWLLPYDPDRMPVVLSNLLSREKNITVSYASLISSCEVNDGQIQTVQYLKRRKQHQISAAVFIDAGSSVLIKQAGSADPLDLTQRQLSGFGIELSGVPWNDDLPFSVPYELYQAVMRGDLPLYARWTSVTRGNTDQQLYLKINFPPESQIQLVKSIVARILKVLSVTFPAFRSGKVIWKTAAPFTRNGLVLSGKYLFKDRDVSKGKKFPDAILNGAWPMEFWDPNRGPTYKYLSEGEHYQLPLRSLRSCNITNLFAAGRCVSAQPGAMASLRVGGLCLASGASAGSAAADLLQRTTGAKQR